MDKIKGAFVYICEDERSTSDAIDKKRKKKEVREREI